MTSGRPANSGGIRQASPRGPTAIGRTGGATSVSASAQPRSLGSASGWPGLAAGAFSANRGVDRAVYGGDRVAERVAEILTSPGTTLCFDASDLMPTAMRNAFHRAVLAYPNRPDRLPDPLKELERIRQATDRARWLDFAFGR